MTVAPPSTRGERERTNDNRPIYTASVGLTTHINPFPNEIHPSGDFFIARARVSNDSPNVAQELENRDSEVRSGRSNDG